MPLPLQVWRQKHNLKQVDAAALLGVSQTYLSLLEKGERSLTEDLRAKLTTVKHTAPKGFTDDRFRGQLSALGYPGFAHVKPARLKPPPAPFLLSVLCLADVDSRVVEALPWVVRNYCGRLDLPWLVRSAKLQNLQNRLGFLLQAAPEKTPGLAVALTDLTQARLLQESTLCWDSMPNVTREWMRQNRSALAQHWNVVTTLRPEDESRAA